jgi:hypothetical protein
VTTSQHTPQEQDVPLAGSTVSLVSLGRDVVVLAELESWDASPTGLVVTSHVTTTPEIAAMLDGERTWASTYTPLTNTLVVFEGVASQAREDRPGRLVISGVSVIAREHRRAEPRAQVPGDVHLRVEEADDVTGRTLDLSRSGCRIEVARSDDLLVGDVATAELVLDDSTVVRTDCRVLRLDEGSRQAVLQFEGTDTAAMAVLSRSVFSRLSAEGPVQPAPA